MSTAVDEFDFELPKELIAQFPLENREDARLMVIHRDSGEIKHRHVRDLPEILSPNDCLVQNDSKVIPAKLNGRRIKTGGRWTGLFINVDEHGVWNLLAKTRGKVAIGESIQLLDREGKESFVLELIAKLDDGSWAARCSQSGSPFEILDQVGSIPLPHYIRSGNMVDEDIVNYQTTFAKSPGSIAAPTAGLHFTNSLLEKLESRQVAIERVTLHVGIGTFKPMSSDNLEEHVMHSESVEVDQQTARSISEMRRQGKRIIAVGTTSVRSLESCTDENGTTAAYSGSTDLFIHPPYQFKAIDGLLTNFHLPRSTLLVLVRTFGGSELMKNAYSAAIDERYRFFSYGDAMLIL